MCTSSNLSECTRNIFRSDFSYILFRYERQHPNNNMNIWANQNKIQILMLYHINLFLFFFSLRLIVRHFSSCLLFGSMTISSACLSTNHWISIHLWLFNTDERDAIQKKTFTKWVNKHLKKVISFSRFILHTWNSFFFGLLMKF